MLNFQMGSSDPPGTYEIPGLKDNLYGKFTVNQRTVREYYQSTHNPHHIAWLRQLAPQIGIGSLPNKADRGE